MAEYLVLPGGELYQVGASSCHLCMCPASPASCQNSSTLATRTSLLLPNRLWLWWKWKPGLTLRPRLGYSLALLSQGSKTKEQRAQARRPGRLAGWLGSHCGAYKLGLLASLSRAATRPVILPSAPVPVGGTLRNALGLECQ